MVQDCLIYINGMKVIVHMHQVDLSIVDLNLLKLFEALVRERSVTQAGLRLGLSQPAATLRNPSGLLARSISMRS